MTCVAGLVCDGKVWMAADSAGCEGWRLRVRADEKVFRNGPYLIGFTSSFRMGQVLRYAAELPAPAEGADLSRFMAVEFVDAVRAALKAAGFATRKDDAEAGGTFLVGYRDRLFQVEADYQVAEAEDPFDAVGCGADVALGSLYTSAGRPAARASAGPRAPGGRAVQQRRPRPVPRPRDRGRLTMRPIHFDRAAHKAGCERQKRAAIEAATRRLIGDPEADAESVLAEAFATALRCETEASDEACDEIEAILFGRGDHRPAGVLMAGK